jgi:hypothetical protein
MYVLIRGEGVNVIGGRMAEVGCINTAGFVYVSAHCLKAVSFPLTRAPVCPV